MIPNASDRSVESNMTGEKIAMRLDQNSTAHLMTVLTDLYEDPESAVLRESVTNARDSHIVAGNSAPVEVYLPTELSPSLRVKDYGVGMSRDDIVEIYSLYGASTKRESNEVNGVLGLGCKAPLTYTDQFIVIGTKDGVKTMVSVSREQDGAGTMTIVEESATSEPNGVEVIVPTRRNNSFAEKAAALFQYWEAATVLVDGEEPARIEGLTVSGSIMLVKSVYSHDTVVMAGVPYKIPQEFSPLGRHGGYVTVAWVDNGDVNFTPSRESLQMTGRTKARLEKLKFEANAAVTAAVQKEVTACTKPYEALAKATSWRSAVRSGIGGLQFKGQDIPRTLLQENQNDVIEAMKQERRGSHKTYNGVDPGIAQDSLFVTGFDVKFTSRHKAKLIQYCADSETDPRRFFLTGDTFTYEEWLDPDRIVDWETVKPIVVEKSTVTANGHVKITGSYVGWIDTVQDNNLLADEIDQSKPIYYMTNDMFGSDRWYDPVVTFANSVGIRGTIVHMGLNRVDKFCRDFPKALSLKDGIKLAYDAYVKALSKSTIESMTLQQSNYAYVLRELVADKVVDPELRRAARLVRVDVSDKTKTLNKFRNHWAGAHLNLDDKVKILQVDKRYPLLTQNNVRHEDAYLYINAKYQQLQEAG